MMSAACGRANPAPPPGDVVAALAAESLVGSGAFDASALRGKPALVMFVSASCVHCLKEVPIAQDVARDAGAASAIVFVSGARPNAASFVSQTHFAGPALYDDGTLKKQYAITAVPYTLALAADGHATAAFIGEQDADALREALR
nr:TlpA disulfide reductase family protein [Kofleriaceae bacterium]